MKNILGRTLFTSLIICLYLVPCHASVIEYDAGTYSTPDNYSVLYRSQTINMHHSYYYILGLHDLSGSRELDTLNIVFHSIYNWIIEENWLNVYLFNEPTSYGWQRVALDNQSLSSPDWATAYNATNLGTWSYVDETKDVVFTTSDPALLAYLQDGQGFGIGIDPDCHFYGSHITVETNAPVPEPATLILLGTGLIGLAGFRQKYKK